jgi:ketosteroid isomerase-like protein
MSERIHELLHRNLQEVFGEGDAARRLAAIQKLYTDDCVLYVPPGVFVGHDALENSPETCARRTRTSSTCLTVLRRHCITLEGLHGGRAHAAESRTTLAWM